MNYLILTEGKRPEYRIFSKILEKYGFTVNKQSIKILDYEDINIDKIEISELTEGKNYALIAQAPRNRLGDLLRYYKKKNYDINKVFRKEYNFFNYVFLIFDVDHTSNEDLEEIFNYHNDEGSDGLLLISSPCIEILSEPDRKEVLKENHLETYKHRINTELSLKYHMGAGEYIIKNFEELCLKFLEKNYNDFKSKNIMEHPSLVIKLVNDNNFRSVENVEYRYFTTVIYVLIAHIFGLTKEIDNYELVYEFFKNHIWWLIYNAKHTEKTFSLN